MLEFSELDFILTSLLCYLCGVGTGLGFCAKYKEQFLRSISNEDLSAYNHHNYQQEAIVLPQPTAPTITEITLK